MLCTELLTAGHEVSDIEQYCEKIDKKDNSAYSLQEFVLLLQHLGWEDQDQGRWPKK